MENFFAGHCCSPICRRLGLTVPKEFEGGQKTTKATLGKQIGSIHENTVKKAFS
jgi:hypothetical protein